MAVRVDAFSPLSTGLGSCHPFPVPFRLRARRNRVIDPHRFDDVGSSFPAVRVGTVLRTQWQASSDAISPRRSCCCCSQRGDLLFLFVGQHAKHRRVILDVAVHRTSVNAVEIGKQRIEILHRVRIVLVVVAASAFERRAQKDGAGGDHAIDHIAHVHLFLIEPPSFVVTLQRFKPVAIS